MEGLGEAAKKIGLTEESIQAAGESRLRSARLYGTEADQVLYINVNVIGDGFSVGLEYQKLVFDPLSAEAMYAATWDTRGTGTHSGNSGYILSVISQDLDEFLVEFLRVNEAACAKR